MRIKKVLQKQADIDHKSILDRNKDFYEKFVEEHYPAKEKKEEPKYKRKLALISSSIAVIIVSVILCVILYNLPDEPNLPQNEPAIKEYLQENELNLDSDLSEANNELKKSRITFSDDFYCNATLIYDSVSGDKLAYVLDIENETTFEWVYLFIKVNKDYNHSKAITAPKEIIINGLTVIYNETSILDDDIYVHTARAVIDTGEEIIYIDYDQYSFDEGSNFMSFLANTIKEK